jgi:hypothetical protein
MCWWLAGVFTTYSRNKNWTGNWVFIAVWRVENVEIGRTGAERGVSVCAHASPGGEEQEK